MDTPKEPQAETAASETSEKEPATKDEKVVLGEEVQYKMWMYNLIQYFIIRIISKNL